MSGIEIEWIVIVLFCLLFVGSVIGEVFWLVRKQWALAGRAVAYVLVTDLISFGIGSLVVLTIFFIMFMMVMGPAGTGGNAPESAYVATSLIAILFPPIFLIISKRLFISVFKIRSGKSAWIYSLVISLLILFVVLVPPPLVYYVIVKIWK